LCSDIMYALLGELWEGEPRDRRFSPSGIVGTVHSCFRPGN